MTENHLGLLRVAIALHPSRWRDRGNRSRDNVKVGFPGVGCIGVRGDRSNDQAHRTQTTFATHQLPFAVPVRRLVSPQKQLYLSMRSSSSRTTFLNVSSSGWWMA